MFSLFGSHKLICPHCEHKSDEGSTYCAKCGLTLGRQQPDAAWREHAYALNFAFDDLYTAEFLPLSARFSVSVRREKADLFAQYFKPVALTNALTSKQLQALLEPMVRKIALEFTGALSLHEMQENTHFRQQLDERMRSALNLSIAQYGLAVIEAIALEVRHDKLSAEREKLGEKIGTLWLVIDEKRAQLDHGMRLDALYSNTEWQKIAREEEQIRLRYRREEMRQKFGKDLSWLYLHGEHEDAKKRLSRAKLKQDENERLQTIRARELELYGRIVDAATRKEALHRGAAESIKDLEHAHKGKTEDRQNESDQWLHVRTLARIKMRTESEITQLESKQSMQLMQQRVAHQLEKIQLEHNLAQAQMNDDQQQRRVQSELLRTAQDNLTRREQELADEEQKNRLITLSIVTEAKAREFQRMQALEEERLQQQKRALQREDSIKDSASELQVVRLQQSIGEITRAGLQADALVQHKKLLLTLEAHAILERQKHQAGHQQRLADQAHEALLARIAIERINTIANLSETGKVATAEAPNAAALAEILKLQTQAKMSSEQILASQAGLSAHAAQAMGAVASAPQSLSYEQAIKMLQERLDREHQDKQAELERRHKIDLTIAQNAASSRSFGAGQTGRK